MENAPESRVAALFSDVTGRQEAEAALQRNLETLHHDAHHDTLTGSPNRVSFGASTRRASNARTMRSVASSP